MAAKSIIDVIQIAMQKPAPAHQFPQTLAHDLKRFFEYRITVLDAKNLGTELLAVDLFGDIFADLPVHRNENKEKEVKNAKG